MPETDPTEFDEQETAVAEDDGPDVEDLESDPAYNPDDEDLQSIKGG